MLAGGGWMEGDPALLPFPHVAESPVCNIQPFNKTPCISRSTHSTPQDKDSVDSTRVYPGPSIPKPFTLSQTLASLGGDMTPFP